MTFESLEINPPNISPKNYVFSYLDLFKYKSLRIKSYSAVVLFFSICAVFYGTSFSMALIWLNLYKSIIWFFLYLLYINIALIAVSETLAYAITGKDNFYVKDFLIPLIKRKRTIFTGKTISFLLQDSYFFLKVPENC